MKWKEDFLKCASPLEPHIFPFVIIGNKCDKESERKVQSIKVQ